MKPILMAGTTIVVFALLFYTIGIITEQRLHRVTKKVLFFLTFGVIFDISATVCMIIGSSKGWFTLHGFLGYSSLGAMLLETFFAWQYNLKNGEVEVTKFLHIYSRIAYIWWVVAFISGGLLVVLAR
ncbi:MAG: hypothetical protein DRP35_05000 [Candidatus Zixiibacteriota bacterium]|nr:MAG: hypothetical protein DRP35_05000 [candidate division Zixibacteria bacterium]